ncbi:MAG: zinc dependent phospholipase C family protein [Tractidigestivibacter sp.]|jgi:hypothetical protein|uniref:zinc dependent phospholipase C family protein n=1 Tax=Tractidigestivibacter sp. TaxID=2847320 RepID=UPI003D8E2F29
MPALITHHIFGEDVVTKLPEGIVEGEEELLAFLLGNQGPDPFFAAFFMLPERASECHRFAHAMHEKSVVNAFLSVRNSVGHLPRADERIGRAFSLGMLAHYVLDSTTHPFVFSEQFDLLKEMGLPDASAEVHALIESDIDSWILWEKRKLTILESPASANLASTARIDRVAGALFSQTAMSVFGIGIEPEDYASSLRDYRWIFRRIDPAGSPKTRLISDVERLGRPHSMAASMAHRVVRTSECPAANLKCHFWENPYTGQMSQLSFADLFVDATERYPRYAESFIRGNRDDFSKLVGGINYDGCPGSAE